MLAFVAVLPLTVLVLVAAAKKPTPIPRSLKASIAMFWLTELLTLPFC